MKPMVCIILIFVMLLAPVAVAAAMPPKLPSAFHGTVTVNGRDVPVGTTVLAVVNGKIMAGTRTQMYMGQSVYSIIVPECAEGAVIMFQVIALKAQQTGSWHSGTSVELNLTAQTIKKAYR